VSSRPQVRERRGFVNAAHGQVHYRIAGSGPPVVLLHDAPRSSTAYRDLLRWLGEEFTVVAPDLPGYGNSTPLPASPQSGSTAPPPAIADFARAVDAALEALGIGQCVLYGFHGSSKIALELAAQGSDRLSGVILEGLSLPLSPPEADFIGRYMRPLELSDDGSHLAREWTRVRDQHRFYPWFAKSSRSRIAADIPEEKQLHRAVIDLFSSGRHYSSAYAAAMRHHAIPLIGRIRTRTVIACRADDPLFRYLDALPENRPAHVTVERLPAENEAWREKLRDLFRDLSQRSATRRTELPDPLRIGSASTEVRGYVDLPHGQIMVRRRGNGSRRPVLLLHETPGCSAQLQPLLQALSGDRVAIACDLPGLGDSDPLPNPDVAAYRDALLGMLDVLQLASIDVIAEFTAAPLALELARAAPERVNRLVLDGVFVFSASERRQLWKSYCPPLRPSWDGAHLHALWHRLRDQELNWPWFDGSASAIRKRDPELGAERLQTILVDIMKRPEHYGDACLAAFEYPLKDVIGEVRQPVLLPQVADDIRYQWTRKVARRLANAQLQPRSAVLAERAKAWSAFLDGGEASA